MKGGDTALHAACLEGHKTIVECLIKHGALVDAVDNVGSSALFCSTQNCHTDCSELLLHHGADINKLNGERGLTAFHIACCNGDIATAQVLLDFHANLENNSTLDIATDMGNTALHLASREGLTEMVDFLLKKGAHSSANIWGMTPLHLYFMQTLKESSSRIIHDLCNHDKMAIHVKDINGWTPLCLSMRLNDLLTCELLMKYGADDEIKDIHGLTVTDHKGLGLRRIHKDDRSSNTGHELLDNIITMEHPGEKELKECLRFGLPPLLWYATDVEEAERAINLVIDIRDGVKKQTRSVMLFIHTHSRHIPHIQFFMLIKESVHTMGKSMFHFSLQIKNTSSPILYLLTKV